MDRWEYLVSKEYRLRHHICEYYLDYNLNFIIDIGAYKNTLKSNDWIIPIDPLKSIPDSYHGSVAEWVNEHNDLLKDDNYGVMALGLEIEGDENQWNSFYSLIEGSKVAIIEHSIEHEPSVKQFNLVMETTSKKLVTLMDFEFCDMQTPGFVPHKKRRLAVLERK
jgi:hypothetical protein